MKKKIIVHCSPKFLQAALTEDNKLAEYYVERSADKPLAGNVYKGRVMNVLPGMQAAFVDIGQGKNAFLYIDDVLPAHLERQPKVKPSITDLLKEGQELIVQIAKEPLGTKGARVTTHFSLPGRWLVYMPNADYVGVSRKISTDDERERLKYAAESLRLPGEGLIVRTVAEGADQEDLSRDLAFLRDLWSEIYAKAETARAPFQLYRDLDLLPRLVRDLVNEQIDEIITDDRGKAEEMRRLLKGISAKMGEKVTVYEGAEPIFSKYQIQESLERAFRRKVGLISGGYLILDQTEALTVIDVNTGKYTGSDDLEETVYATNMEAVAEVARLIRLRDLGGIIIVDFIDMSKEEHRKQVVELLEHLLRADRTKTLIVGWTRLGLLELTRKKVREHKDSLFFDTCSVCGGSGKVPSRYHPLFERRH